MAHVPLLRARNSGTSPVRSRPRCRPRGYRPWLECLEDRVVLSAGASIVTEYLADPGGVVLNPITLDAGDVVTARVNTGPYGGGLNSLLRVFRDVGGGSLSSPIASNDNFQGLDAGLTFQASAPGVYYVGVSSADSSHGLFHLRVSKTSTA